ncbi:lipase family protein [Gordonia sp. 'Campus']|uniref:lipase family protein n=1 Tax=Gordonia sp. 'Campus' TaxID=2915824 RepID=UPI001EE40DF4|nr:lipase family protein [Gordonia sp. 'Campus']
MLVTVLVVAALLVGACSSSPGASTSDAAPDTTVPAGASAGDLVGSPIPTESYISLRRIVDRTLRFRYLSTDPDSGGLTPVSAAVFVPRGRPPAGGWQVLAVGHPTTGTAGNCAPSLHAGLLGTVSLVASMLELGFVVVQTDYQGLGTPGRHRYLDPAPAARAIIDSVRATRTIIDDTSDQWWGFGVSQGGHAVFHANEIAGTYGRGLTLRGTVSMSPALDVAPLADAMAAGTLTEEQIAFLPLVLTGLQTIHPELVIDDYVRGPLREAFGIFLECEDVALVQKQAVVEATRPEDYRPVDAAATDRLRGWLREVSLPQGRAAAPMLIAYSDGDEVIPAPWTAKAIDQACRQGDVITSLRVRNQPHGILDIGSAATDWVAAVRSGQRTPNTCA